MDREKNDDYPNDPLDELDDDPQEVLHLDVIEKPEESEEDAETTGGVGQAERQRNVGRRFVTAVISRKDRAVADEESTGGLGTTAVSALVASYAAYAAAYAMRLEQRSRDGSMLTRLAAVRAELQKRCIIDVILPLLAHVNPFVQVTAAIDLLCSVFEQGDRAVHVLKIAQGGGRGFLPFLAGFALDTYFHAQLAPVPDKILREASRLYGRLPRSINHFNGNALTPRNLPLPEKVLSWDGNEHTGTFISLTSRGSSEKYYAQHIGMNEYHMYRAGQLNMIPQDGERYHVGRDGTLRQTIEQTRIKQTRGKS